MRRSEASAGNRQAWVGRYKLALSLLAVVVVSLVCGLALGIASNHNPASALSLSFYIEPLSFEQVNPDQVVMQVLVSNGSTYLDLSHGRKLTCDGVAFLQGHITVVGGIRKMVSTDMRITLPPQPPGGAYTCVYTDETGQQTTLEIPANNPQILSLREGDVAPIPGSQTSGQTSGQAPPLVVSYLQPSLPAGGFSDNYAVAGWRAAACPELPECAIFTPCGSPNECGGIVRDSSRMYGPVAATTTSLTFEDLPFFQPGPGWIELHATLEWTQTNSSFASVGVHVEAQTGIHITWTRG
jgi:hypothetical protein